jgi:hypothetical protein
MLLPLCAVFVARSFEKSDGREGSNCMNSLRATHLSCMLLEQLGATHSKRAAQDKLDARAMSSVAI